MRYTSSQDDANDVFHEAMIRVFRNLEKARQAKDFNAWVSRVAINASIDAFKQRKKKTFKALEEVEAEPFDEGYIDALEEMKAEEIVKMLQLLPESQMVTFNMYVDGYSHKEIAEQLKIAESTSRVLLTRAKRRIAELLRKSAPDERRYG